MAGVGRKCQVRVPSSTLCSCCGAGRQGQGHAVEQSPARPHWNGHRAWAEQQQQKATAGCMRKARPTVWTARGGVLYSTCRWAGAMISVLNTACASNRRRKQGGPKVRAAGAGQPGAVRCRLVLHTTDARLAGAHLEGRLVKAGEGEPRGVGLKLRGGQAASLSVSQLVNAPA